MKNLNRRELGMALSAFAMMSSLSAEGQAGTGAGPSTGPQLLKSEIFPFDSLPVKPSSNGGASRAVLHGTLATGEVVEVHETLLPPGQMPHQPHRHTHSEFQLIREGKIQVLGEGPNGIIGPGRGDLQRVRRSAWTEKYRRYARELLCGGDRRTEDAS